MDGDQNNLAQGRPCLPTLQLEQTLADGDRRVCSPAVQPCAAVCKSPRMRVNSIAALQLEKPWLTVRPALVSEHADRAIPRWMATIFPQLDDAWRCLLLLLDHPRGAMPQSASHCQPPTCAGVRVRARVHVTLPQVPMSTDIGCTGHSRLCELQDQSSPVHKPATMAGQD